MTSNYLRVGFTREFITNVRDWAIRADVNKLGPLGQYALQVGPLKWTLSTIDKGDDTFFRDQAYQKITDVCKKMAVDGIL